MHVQVPESGIRVKHLKTCSLAGGTLGQGQTNLGNPPFSLKGAGGSGMGFGVWGLGDGGARGFTGLLANFHGSFMSVLRRLSHVHWRVSGMGKQSAWETEPRLPRHSCGAGCRRLAAAGACLGIYAICMRLTNDDQQSHATVANTKATCMLFFPPQNEKAERKKTTTKKALHKECTSEGGTHVMLSGIIDFYSTQYSMEYISIMAPIHVLYILHRMSEAFNVAY